jgi:lycopene beta-cyclase
MTMADALVLGKGPAALAAAAALAEAGLGTVLAGPGGPVAWTARYAAWVGEIPEELRPAAVQARWAHAVVVGERRHRLERPYALLDNPALAAALGARCDAGGVRRFDGVARRVEHGPRGSAVAMDDGVRLEARVVVDATGAGGTLLEGASPAVAVQAAIGWTVEAEGVPLDPAAALLMDWTPVEPESPPTFLYGFPLPGGAWFLEETALAARPPVDDALLERRLAARMQRMGIHVSRRLARERVRIPLGSPPPRAQRVIGFGAAGGMIHPATGYSVARALREAPTLARALADALGRGAAPEAAAAAAWRALWPADARRRRALQLHGLEALLGMTGGETRAFFDAFFSVDAAAWSGYLSDRPGTGGLLATMARVYRAAPAPVRRRLRAGLASSRGLALAREVLAV